jgi:hypothetical protein
LLCILPSTPKCWANINTKGSKKQNGAISYS